MSKRSLPDVSAKLIADIESFVADFKRADNESRRSMANIDKQVDQLQKSIKKKFSAADIGKSVLSGLGIGSGFQIAQQAADMMVGYFRQQADFAKSAEESTAKILELTKQLISLNQSPEQKLAVLRAEEEAAKRAFLEANKPRTVQLTTVQKLLYSDAEIKRLESQVLPPTGEQQEAKRKAEIAFKQAELARKEFQMALEKKAARDQQEVWDKAGETASKEQEERIRRLAAAQRVYDDGYKDLIDTQAKSNEQTERERLELERLAEGFRRMADPLRAFRIEREELEKARSLLTSEQYALAGEDITNRMVGTALDDFFGSLDEQSKLYSGIEKLEGVAKDMGFAFTSAFEDAILAASSFSDVVDGLIKDIARMAIRSAITAPLGNWIGGMVGGLFGRASGGPVKSGDPYVVGERGPELFVPSASGAIVPNERLAGLGRGGRGDSFAFTYNIGAGVTQSQLMPILAMQKREIIGAIADAKRRRQPMSASL